MFSLSVFRLATLIMISPVTSFGQTALPTWVDSWKSVQASSVDSVSVDVFQNAQHDLSWFRANHPEWLLYSCDRTTPLVANDPGSVIPDFTNSAYINFKWDTEFAPAIQAMGSLSRAIVLDAALLEKSSYACGVYDTQGRWTQKFLSGGLRAGGVDPAFADSVIAY